MSDQPLTIQRLTAVDEALAAQLNVVFAVFDDDQAWDAAQGRAFLANPENLFLVARWDGEVCGYLTAYRLQRFDQRRAEVVLYDIAVLDRFRRRGVATSLIAALKRWAAAVGADEVWVLADTDDAAAKAFYAASGGHQDLPDATMFTYPIAAQPRKTTTS